MRKNLFIFLSLITTLFSVNAAEKKVVEIKDFDKYFTKDHQKELLSKEPGFCLYAYDLVGFKDETVKIATKRIIHQFPEYFTVDETEPTLVKDDDCYYFISGKGFLPGEKVTFAVNYPSDLIWELTPYPLYTQANGKKIEAELVKLNPTVYEIRCYGYENNSKLYFNGESEKEKIEQQIIVDTNKPVIFTFCPEVPTKTGGIAKASVNVLKGEKLTLHLPWGEALLEFEEGKIPQFDPNSIDKIVN
ncbi:MAG: hypothetical protein BGO10_08770 [Chlamydia sp. 32-24]|nr:MAG: hypothetical protein BGO10_08770 [Chlamydia sp. 32-24]